MEVKILEPAPASVGPGQALPLAFSGSSALNQAPWE